MLEIENKSITMADLEDSGEFETLEAKLASALYPTFPLPLQRKIQVLEEKAHTHAQVVTGRQHVLLMFQSLCTNETDCYFVDIEDLRRCHMIDQDLEGFLHTWEHTLSGMNPDKIPPKFMLEDMFAKEVGSQMHIDGVWFHSL